MAFLDKKDVTNEIDCEDFKPQTIKKDLCIFSEKCANAGKGYIKSHYLDENISGCTGIPASEGDKEYANEEKIKRIIREFLEEEAKNYARECWILSPPIKVKEGKK